MRLNFIKIVMSAACIVAMFLHLSPVQAQDQRPCKTQTFENNSYTICEAPLSHYTIKLFWQKPDGQPYNYLNALPKAGDKDQKLVFALNAGMFDPGYKPVGLYVEAGKELVKANTRSGFGNFHLKPNGIFYFSDTEAGVLETGAYLKSKPKAAYATQSGPMLVIDGKLHPRIAHASVSAKSRDGVCVRDAKTVVFAVSDGNVPFDTFERLFRDQIKCRNALFLDGGSAPALYFPSPEKGNNFLSLGPMIGVYQKR